MRFISVMRKQEEVIGKLTSVAVVLLIFYIRKNPNNFCLTNMGFNVTENCYSSSFAIEIVIMLPYGVFFFEDK